MRKIKVGITHGDINGVGYEVILKTFQDEAMFDICTPIVYGSPKIATFHRKAIDVQTNFSVRDSAAQADEHGLTLVNCFGEEEIKVDFAQATSEAGKAAYVSLEKAMEEYKQGLFDVLVTAPINKFNIQGEGFSFPGHTEYIENRVGDGSKAMMILMRDNLRVALVTTHYPISEVAQHISRETLTEKIQILNNTLKRDFAIEKPRIAVLGLNPHCGDGGVLGNEEKEIIAPVVEELFGTGICCFGPYPADGFFGSGNYEHFDAILAMYHDQGLAPFKLLAGDEGVNYTAGLPIIRTSPAHGTAYDIAGKGMADENSFRHAVYAAIDIARHRRNYDIAHAHPLRRQYFEKRDDSDKLKLDESED